MMVRGDDGSFSFGMKEMGKFFLAMLSATTIPLITGVAIFYGDKRVMESTQASQGEKIKALEITSQNHESRITVIETKERIEQ